MSIKKKILIIAPHADDEVLGVGGTTHKMLLENIRQYIAKAKQRSRVFFHPSILAWKSILTEYTILKLFKDY